MRSQTWKSCLGVLCLLVAGTANAAKISFSDKGFIDVGALVQAQFRMEQDGAVQPASAGASPSYDFFLRRARIALSGQYDEHIGFIIDTDITYGSAGGAGVPGPSGVGGAGYVPTGYNNNIFLNQALGTYKVNGSFMIDAGLIIIPYSHNSLTSAGKYASVNNFLSFYPPNSQRATRDAGIVIRGLLLDDRIYYRLGVFNGVQSGAPPTGAAVAATNTLGVPPTPGVNPGDAPAFAGMLRFNFAGKEDGYAFCQVCFSPTPIISLGVSSWYQANSFRGPAPTGPTTAPINTRANWATYNADLFASVPFGSDVEVSLDVLGSLVQAGTNTPESGWGVQGLLSLRFGWFGPYFQMEYFNSDTQYVGRSSVAPTGTQTAAQTRTYAVGDFTTYRGGFSVYVEKHVYKISAEVAYTDRQNAGQNDAAVGGTGGTSAPIIPNNRWVGTLQFQVNF